MSLQIEGLIDKFRVLDHELWLSDSDDRSLLVNAFKMVIDWHELLFTLKVTDRLFTEEEAAAMSAVRESMKEYRAIFDRLGAAAPARRRHLGVVSDPESQI